MAVFPWQFVTVDVDGTLTRGHGWREIARAFGREPAFEATSRRFREGRIGEDEHLENLLDLAAGRTVDEVVRVVARTPKLAGIAEGVGELHALGARVALLTHNPGYVVAYYRRAFGFDDEACLSVPVGPEGSIGPAPRVHADKVAWLRALLARYGVGPRTVVHVGDGRSDAEVFRHVGGGVALNAPFDDVNRAADARLSSGDFRDLVPILQDLLPRP